MPAIQLVNYLIYPLQLILFLPFLQAGSRIIGAAPVTLSMTKVFGMMKSDRWSLIKMVWSASLGAMAIWIVMGTLAIAAVYFTPAPVLRRLVGMSLQDEPDTARLGPLVTRSVRKISNFPTSFA